MTAVTARFDLGRVVVTATALHELTERCGNEAVVHLAVGGLLARHVRGDWGDVGEEDARANEAALVDGTRLLSIYLLFKTKLYVITDGESDACAACWAGVGECEPEKGSWQGGIHFRDDLPPRRLATTVMLPEDY